MDMLESFALTLSAEQREAFQKLQDQYGDHLARSFASVVMSGRMVPILDTGYLRPGIETPAQQATARLRKVWPAKGTNDAR